ncbi:MAG: hypothetical protein Dbin4_01622 [Alphaproteobacteria bacterium]|nr:hypothetical protein [Alphaproteobacteria bacterium]
MPPILVVMAPYPIEQARAEALGALARARTELMKAARLLHAMGKELPARNWEQGRNAIDPAARALLVLVARDPKGTLTALAAARAA